jgi:predicted permease
MQCILARLLGALLYLYPKSFREEFGPALRALAERDLSARALADVAASAMRQRLRAGSTGELRRAARTMLRTPAFSIPIVATLAIAVGATATVFSVVHAVLIKSLPYREPDRLAWIASVRTDRADAPFSLPEVMDLRARARTIDIAAYTSWNPTLAGTGGDPARRLQGMRISANAFQILGADAAAGRLLMPSDDEASAAHVAVISHAYWKSELAGAADAIGRTLRLNGDAYTVVGVLPRYLPLPIRDFDVVVPLVPELDARRHARNSVNFLRLLGRVRDGVSSAAAESELTAVTNDLKKAFPVEYASKLGVRLTPLHRYIVGDHRQTLLVLLGCVGLIVAIAFANICGLLLVRATVKQGEIAVRRALGASTSRVATQAFAEAVVLAAMGATLGVALAVVGVQAVVIWGPSDVPRLDEARVDPTVLAAVVAMAAIGTLFFAVASLASVNRSAPQLALRAAGRGQGEGQQQARARIAFLIAQIAFAVVLATAAGGMLTSLMHLRRVELGFRPDSVFVARIALPSNRFRTASSISQFYDKVQSGLTATPGVVGAGVTSIAPLSDVLSSVPFSVVGRAPAEARERLRANFRAVSPGYFAAIGASLRAGRAFGEHDDPAAVPVAVVSEALAAQYLRRGDPIGQQLLIDDNNNGPRPVTVVGVVRTMRHIDLNGAPSLDIYIPLRQIHPDGVTFVTNNQFWTVRVASDPSTFNTTFARILRAADPDAAMSRMGTMNDYIARWLAPRQFSVALLVIFGIVAVGLASFGVYGVVAYGVARRRREIGLRLALGASASGVLGLVLRQTMQVALIGVAFGILFATLSGRALSGMLFGITANDPLLLAGVASLLTLTSVVASLLPAWHASRINPTTALAGD